MSEEIKSIYEFINKQKEIAESIAEQTKGTIVEHNQQGAATAYWVIGSFIEENFIYNS